MKKKTISQSNKKKILTSVIIIIAVFALIVNIMSGNNLSEDKTVTITQGSSTMQIADTLKKEDVISSKILFFIKANLSEYRGQLKYGVFSFSPEDSYDDVIKKIATQGALKKTVTITIPEGYSVEMIINKLKQAGLGTESEIKKALNASYDYEFLKKIKVSSQCKYKLQGFLFPSTYEFYTDSKPYDVIDTMLAEFEKQYKTTGSSYDNLFETITKASLIEREARVDIDRKKIAGVIENRLSSDMKLQIDASVIYAISDGLYNVERVLYKDLEANSPYNTYKYKGLPIGPIANPGIKSIKAALQPEKHNYLYYRTDTKKNDGSHIFTETFEEHTNANK